MIQILNEVYFGETDDIKKMIQLVHDFRTPYLNKHKFSFAFYGASSNKNLMALAEHIEDMFGIYAVDFDISNVEYKNACTYPIIYSVDCMPEEHIYSDKGGFKYDKKMKYCMKMEVTAPLMFDKDITDREITAIILHEIGHNFVTVQEQLCPVVVATRDGIVISCIIQAILDLAMLNPYASVLDIMMIFKNTNFIKLFKAKVNKFFKKTPLHALASTFVGFVRLPCTLALKFVRGAFKIFGISDLFKSFYVFCTGFTMMSDKTKQTNIKNIKTQNSSGRSMEYFSDNFAASYGLGPELTSGLKKIEFEHKKKISNTIAKINPLVHVLESYSKIPYYEIMCTCDVHPMYVERANKVIADLEKELQKKDMNPRLRKELQENLRQTKAQMAEFRKAADKYENNPTFWREVWQLSFGDEPNENKFLTADEKEYTSMKDRDKAYKDMYQEYVESLGYESDPYEFD